MTFRGPLCALAVIALIGASSGCSCASEHVSEPATVATGRWRKAYVTVSYHPSFYKNGHKHPPSVLHALTIEDAPPNQDYVILRSDSEGDIPDDLFEKLRNTSYVVQISPDDSTLAASTDAGKSWVLFDLQSIPDSTQDPFWCRHRTFASLSPWPSMRGLALELLASLDPTAPHAAEHRSEDAIVWPGGSRAGKGAFRWSDEVLGAARYACSRRTDPELRAAVITAYLHPDFGSHKLDVDQCIGELARDDATLRARLLESTSTRDANWKAHVEWVLKEYATPKHAPGASPSPAPSP